MININEERNRIYGKSFIDQLFPEIYRCDSVTDFVANRDYIKPTRGNLASALGYKGSALVEILLAHFRWDNESTGTIHDIDSFYSIDIRPISGGKREKLKRTSNLYEILLHFDLRYDHVWLIGYRDQIPPIGERPSVWDAGAKLWVPSFQSR